MFAFRSRPALAPRVRHRVRPGLEVLEGRSVPAGLAHTLSLVDDVFEENDSKAAVDARPRGAVNSPNLGLVTQPGFASGLILNDTADWYRFETAGVGTHEHAVRIDFDQASGDLDMQLFRGNETQPVAGREIGNGFEQITLSGERSGVYYVRVFPRFTGTGNPNYTLSIVPPPEADDDVLEENDSQ